MSLLKSILFVFAFSSFCFGQSDTLKIKYALFAETYYLHSATDVKSPIFYNHTTVNQPALNLGLVEFSMQKRNWTIQAGMMLGTYVQKNLASEPDYWKQIYQLNAQIQVNPTNQLVFGIIPSHIGVESAKNSENDCLSRSYIAENSPYYETGITWNYLPYPNLSFRLLALTGWQHIGKYKPALGSQMTFSGSTGWKFNSSHFWGDEGKGFRMFFNHYIQLPLSKQFFWTLGGDVGMESGHWWNGGLTYVTWKPKANIRMSGRLEYYSDPKAIIMPQAFSDVTQSLTIDVPVMRQIVLRSELKHSREFGNELLFAVVFHKQSSGN